MNKEGQPARGWDVADVSVVVDVVDDEVVGAIVLVLPSAFGESRDVVLKNLVARTCAKDSRVRAPGPRRLIWGIQPSSV